MKRSLIPIAAVTLLAAGCGAPVPAAPVAPAPSRSRQAAPGMIQFTASGEVLSLGGYAFPPKLSGDVAFVDGWEVKFDEVLVTLDKIVIAENPDKSPADQSQIGDAVAEVDGPWVVDLHKGGPLLGKGGAGEQAVAIATVANQNLKGGAPFDPTKRYAFNFDVISAVDGAKNVNLDAGGLVDYQLMINNGWSVLYVGTATWKGDAPGVTCKSTDPNYDFSALPKQVKFVFGFLSPSTYVNCQNPDNDPAAAFAGEEHQRGIQVKEGTTTIAQATLHTDHPFWESFVHDSPAHFDQLAALAIDNGSGQFSVSLDDAAGADFTAFADPNGAALPWRSCLPTYTPPDQSKTMHFNSLSIPFKRGGDPTKELTSYADYMLYTESTEGHLNADGLCFVKRNYPSPK